MVLLAIISFLGLFGISLLWVRGIDYMSTNHPDYKGEDFFDS
jgi:hypothetical protein